MALGYKKDYLFLNFQAIKLLINGELYEELEVVGLRSGPLDESGQALPTENAIRAEHRIPLRTAYSGIREENLHQQLERDGVLPHLISRGGIHR